MDPRPTHRLATTLLAAALTAVPFIGGEATGQATVTHLRPGAYIDDTRVPGSLTQSLAVDRAGGKHWIVDGRRYFTLFPGDKRAVRTTVRYSGIASTPRVVKVVPTVTGDAIDVVTANCNSMQVVRVPATARRLPTINRGDDVASSACKDFNFGYRTDAVGLAHGRVAVLVPIDPEHVGSQSSAVYIGRPGHHFIRRPVPDSNRSEINGSAIARDPVGGAVYVAENSQNGIVDVWHATTSHEPFGPPTNVGSTTSTSEVTGIAASHDNVWVAVATDDRYPQRGVRIVSRGPNGHWSRLRRVPFTDTNNDFVVLATNPSSKHASAWEADTPLTKRNGLLTGEGVDIRHLTRNSIGPVHSYSRSLDDTVDSIAVGWNGHVSVAHEVN